MGFILPKTATVVVDGAAVEYTKSWVVNWGRIGESSWIAIPKLLPVKPKSLLALPPAKEFTPTLIKLRPMESTTVPVTTGGKNFRRGLIKKPRAASHSPPTMLHCLPQGGRSLRRRTTLGGCFAMKKTPKDPQSAVYTSPYEFRGRIPFRQIKKPRAASHSPPTMLAPRMALYPAIPPIDPATPRMTPKNPELVPIMTGTSASCLGLSLDIFCVRSWALFCRKQPPLWWTARRWNTPQQHTQQGQHQEYRAAGQSHPVDHLRHSYQPHIL